MVKLFNFIKFNRLTFLWGKLSPGSPGSEPSSGLEHKKNLRLHTCLVENSSLHFLVGPRSQSSVSAGVSWREVGGRVMAPSSTSTSVSREVGGRVLAPALCPLHLPAGFSTLESASQSQRRIQGDKASPLQVHASRIRRVLGPPLPPTLCPKEITPLLGMPPLRS